MLKLTKPKQKRRKRQARATRSWLEKSIVITTVPVKPMIPQAKPLRVYQKVLIGTVCVILGLLIGVSFYWNAQVSKRVAVLTLPYTEVNTDAEIAQVHYAVEKWAKEHGPAQRGILGPVYSNNGEYRSVMLIDSSGSKLRFELAVSQDFSDVHAIRGF